MAGGTILVIDDEASQREAVGGYLRKRGFTVLQADNGRRGLGILQGQVVDLVITDLRMPELDGMGVLDDKQRMFHTLLRDLNELVAETEAKHLPQELVKTIDKYTKKFTKK